MDIYLVGGAVRDQLLGRPVSEKDWVVVGATPQQMLDLGYKPVGKDFPVFLHPQTKEEYALARTERKSGRGYTGFTCYAAPDVTLEEDLKRRDLTINAMAQTLEGHLIDPYGGQADIAHQYLRHVSLAYAEDPLRVLRTARFSASLSGFRVHPETLALMRKLSCEEELLTLSPERIWKELEKVFRTPTPERFFEVLSACSAMAILFPEIKSWHHLKKLRQKTPDPVILLCAFLSDLAPNELTTLAKRIQLPKAYQTLTSLVSQHFLTYQQALSLSPGTLLRLLEQLDAFRRPLRFKQFLSICELKDEGHSTKKKTARLEKACHAAQTIDTSFIKKEPLSPTDIKEAVYKRRLAAIENI